MQTLVFRKVGSHSSPQSMNLIPGVRAVLAKDDVEAQHYVRSRRDDFRARGLVLSYEVCMRVLCVCVGPCAGHLALVALARRAPLTVLHAVVVCVVVVAHSP